MSLHVSPTGSAGGEGSGGGAEGIGGAMGGLNGGKRGGKGGGGLGCGMSGGEGLQAPQRGNVIETMWMASMRDSVGFAARKSSIRLRHVIGR